MRRLAAFRVPSSRRARLIAAVLSVLALAAAAALQRLRTGERSPAIEQRAAALEQKADALLFERGEPRRALAIYRRACELRPSFPLWHKRGIARLESGDPSGAIAAFERALALAPPALDRQRYRAGIAALREGAVEIGRAALDSAYLASRPEASEPVR
ncbi:MAG: tetratricopeptide repeat protein [Planctomycetota bacterium]|nr:MAG: tetratricopeptide repeat protein [Planctomycetota bacterium]